MRAMLFLAENELGGPQPLSRIVQCGLPADYLEQLLGQLRRQGLVRSVRGTHGGYLLAKPAKEITLGQVIDAVEGPSRMVICAVEPELCEQAGHCGMQRTWAMVTEGIQDLMDRYSLHDMLQNTGASQDNGGLA
jgi:Rrf2 family protein